MVMTNEKAGAGMDVQGKNEMQKAESINPAHIYHVFKGVRSIGGEGGTTEQDWNA